MTRTTSTLTRRQTTVRVNGKRMVVTTTAAGKTTVRAAVVPEWHLQAAAVRALRAMPEFGRDFLLAGDMAAGKRGPRAQMQAQATGLTPGDPDLRLYLPQGRVAFIEYKAANGRLSPAQRTRHADMARLGHTVEVVAAASEEECAAASVALVRGWLVSGAVAGNDNQPLLDANARVASYGSSGAVCGSGAARHEM